MEYRRLGRTELFVSAVGFGTCQLRLLPERRAIDTLLKGFELGVNFVHTAPEYGNAERIVAKAVSEAGGNIIIASQGHDVPAEGNAPVNRFKHLFEATCKIFKTDRLDLYGIACIDDREAFKENVWGRNGMVEFLLRKKEEGRIGGIFCTTHGAPEYVSQLVTCGVFDAIVVSYNVLGYHLLSCHPTEGRHFECIDRNRDEIFPLCSKHGVGLIIMKPLGGGLLTRSKAFPPYATVESVSKNLTPAHFLKAILINPEVTCVIPGTASVEEAEENAGAGFAPIALTPEEQSQLASTKEFLRARICSRCGKCESLCSQHLPISWIFRAALINLYPASAFEAIAHMDYFDLHPNISPVCATCPKVSCRCDSGIDIPSALIKIHYQMVDLMKRNLIPPPKSVELELKGNLDYGAKVLSSYIPREMLNGTNYICQLYIENAGMRAWLGSTIAIYADAKQVGSIRIDEEIRSGRRHRIAFEIAAPTNGAFFCLTIRLIAGAVGLEGADAIVLLEKTVGLKKQSTFFLVSVIKGLRDKFLVILREKLTVIPRRFLQHYNIRNKAGEGGKELCESPSVSNQMLDEYTRGPMNESAVNPVENNLVVNLPTGRQCEPSERAYGVKWIDNNLPNYFQKGEVCQIYLSIENIGLIPWIANHPQGKSVQLVVYIDSTLQSFINLPHDVNPGEQVVIGFPFTFPASADNGRWQLVFSFIEHGIAWFHEHGVEPLRVEIAAEEPEKGFFAEALAVARKSNWGFWVPSNGVIKSRSGHRYPFFVSEAKGCRVRDIEGNEWIDYVMCGGSAILGYAYPEIQNAIAEQLISSAVITLPHILEIQVTQMLCEMIPCAEMVLFGKHGSDASTAAIRIAMAHTGRRKILYSGYHGWHDWFAEVFVPQLRITDGPTALFRFELNNIKSFLSLVEAHRGDIAAVIMEPAAQAVSLEGPIQDANKDFLSEVAAICRGEGIVLIFDEIITGFRYLTGSVQKATGVVPDLTCLGKALSAGMPLSALVGKGSLMNKSQQIAYFPTFRGEVYSLAAAAAALQIYRRVDVPEMINIRGKRLKDTINKLSQELGIQGEMIGPPFRMIYRFNEPDDLKRVQKRTLLQQELLKSGILTFKGFMLPSIAHDDTAIEDTIKAFRSALTLIREISEEGALIKYLDIPYI